MSNFTTDNWRVIYSLLSSENMSARYMDFNSLLLIIFRLLPKWAEIWKKKKFLVDSKLKLLVSISGCLLFCDLAVASSHISTTGAEKHSNYFCHFYTLQLILICFFFFLFHCMLLWKDFRLVFFFSRRDRRYHIHISTNTQKKTKLLNIIWTNWTLHERFCTVFENRSRELVKKRT